MEKKLDSNYIKMLRAILNKSWRQHPTKQQLYGHLPPIMKTIKIWKTRHMGHCWRSRDELISDVLLWTPSHGQAKARRPTRTYIQQLYADMGCSPEDLLVAMDNRVVWWERVRYIHADGATWWCTFICEVFKSHLKWRNTQCVSKQSWYYDAQWTPFMAWTALVTWYTHRKLAHTKILQNFWHPRILLEKVVNLILFEILFSSTYYGIFKLTMRSPWVQILHWSLTKRPIHKPIFLSFQIGTYY